MKRSNALLGVAMALALASPTMAATIPNNATLPNGTPVQTVPVAVLDGSGNQITSFGGGGGGGGGAVYGPTAVGSAVANPPVVNGYQTASGNVGVVTPATPLPVMPLPQTALTTASTTSLGTTAVTVDAAQTRRSYVLLHNPANPGGPVISCAFGATAVLNAGGTLTLQAGQYLTYEGSAVPNQALSCIASAASSAFTAQLLDQ